MTTTTTVEDCLGSDADSVSSAAVEPEVKLVPSQDHIDHLDAIEIVKRRLGFDEIAFRDELKREQELINQQIKRENTIMLTVVVQFEQMYDALDTMVNDTANRLYQQQQEDMKRIEGMLHEIRKEAVEAGTLQAILILAELNERRINKIKSALMGVRKKEYLMIEK